MKRLASLSISLAFLFPAILHANADGPDYWQISSKESVALFTHTTSSESILSIPAGTDGITNLGCQGLPSFDEWSNMTEDERGGAKQSAWCQVNYGGVVGWLPKINLAEGHPPSPSYDCLKASGEVENLICADSALMLLDREMDTTYQAAMARIKSLDVGAESELKNLKSFQRGWIKGRNDCWKASDIAGCVEANYQNRISELQAKWMLIPVQKTANYLCADNAEVFITFYSSMLPSASVEIGDKRQIYISQNAENNRYEGDLGKYFEIEKNNLEILFDQFATALSCNLSQIH